ncbi:MAG: TonB-dependent receptor [Pseudomonadota bacterium]
MTKIAARSTLQKALDINVDASRYGTFAEIGAGQEVVRWFFQAGGAAGTISKSISAYDMQVSDAIYGGCQRYVSRQRLEAMLAYEQQLNRDRLAAERGSTTSFFTFADTVSARNYQGTNDCHAWLGVLFQHEPNADDSQVVVHVRMLDDTNAEQQHALGIVGVNLIYGALNFADNPHVMLQSLVDGLSPGRIEIDLVDVKGPAFDGVDNRVLSLYLVELGLTGAALFDADGRVLQSTEVLRKRPLLIQRGRFRPLTHVNMDLLTSAQAKFESMPDVDSERVLPIMEMSMHDLALDDEVCVSDFVSRAEVVATSGCIVMVSDFVEYHRLASFLFSQTDQAIGLALGLQTLRELFKDEYYANLDGGLLESFGRLFKRKLNLLVYPYQSDNSLVTLDELKLPPSQQHLLEYLRELGYVHSIDDVARQHLSIHSPDVLNMIQCGDERWVECVPSAVAERIKAKKLFGYGERRKKKVAGETPAAARRR